MSEYKLFRELEIDGNLSYEGLELSYLPNILEANILDSILKNLINQVKLN